MAKTQRNPFEFGGELAPGQLVDREDELATVIRTIENGGKLFLIGPRRYGKTSILAAAEERLALPIIVWNNDALKEIVDQMDRRHIPRIGVEPKSPDFLRLAESLGCHASRAASAEHLAQSVRDALVADRPTLIEVRQDSPWLEA